MTNTTRTSIFAVVALIIGGVVGYGFGASQPISVTSTDVALNAPAGNAALANARAGILHLDKAAVAVGDGDLHKATSELTDAKTQFAELKKVAADKTQPILVAQEAVIVHRFTPRPDLEAVGEVGKDSANAASLTLTRGHSTKPLALSDYSIGFGNLNVETESANTHVALAIEAAKKGDKAETAKEIRAARGAITFIGDDVEEE